MSALYLVGARTSNANWTESLPSRKPPSQAGAAQMHWKLSGRVAVLGTERELRKPHGACKPWDKS